jgi:hypothetical protein
LIDCEEDRTMRAVLVGMLRPWGHGELAFDAPDVDLIFDPTLKDDLYLALVSEPLGGMSAKGWVTAQTFDFGSLGICLDGGGGGRGNGSRATKHGSGLP